jgi:DNA gyrase subunit A
MSQLGEIRDSRKLPQLVDVSDESDDQSGLRIIVELKSAADAEAVMAYLYKHTPLEQNFNYNATCLVPDPHGAVIPQRCSLVEMLQCFLDFRFETVRRRFVFQLAQLERRIHVLQGFCIVFDGLDQALRIIRRSSGKADAAAKLCKAFPLDDVQANAILEIQLYRISKLEIGRLREELDEKQTEADRIRRILASDRKLWKVVQQELKDISDTFATPRRTSIGSSDEIEHFDPQAYIVRENTNVVVTSEGWIRRLGKISSIDKLRVRDGDEVIAVVPCSTLDHVVFFSSDGTAYTLPAIEIPASTGYGEPIAKHVRLSDGAELVAAFTTDIRFTPQDVEYEGYPPYPYLFVTTAQGQVMRISFSAFREPSTKAGRRYCRLRSGDRVVHVDFMDDEDTVFLMSRAARLIHFNVIEVPVLTGAGKGVRGLKLVDPDDQVLGARRLRQPGDCLYAVNENGRELSFGQMKYQVTSRGGKGVKTSQRTGIKRLLRPEIELVDWAEVDS